MVCHGGRARGHHGGGRDCYGDEGTDVARLLHWCLGLGLDLDLEHLVCGAGYDCTRFLYIAMLASLTCSGCSHSEMQYHEEPRLRLQAEH